MYSICRARYIWRYAMEKRVWDHFDLTVALIWRIQTILWRRSASFMSVIYSNWMKLCNWNELTLFHIGQLTRWSLEIGVACQNFCCFKLMNALKAAFVTAGRNTIFIAIFVGKLGYAICLNSYIDHFSLDFTENFPFTIVCHRLRLRQMGGSSRLK